MQQTATSTSTFGQPVGWPVPDWTTLARPADTPMQGRFCRLEPYAREQHLQGLFEAYAADDGRMWTYLPWGPFADAAGLEQLMVFTQDMFQQFVILGSASGLPLGSASYMRHAPDAGSVEVGAVTFGPDLRRTPAATEAMYLMMRRAFETGYRRYEWKCDALNAPSRAAALRLGFRYEGTFRQERVIKGRNRDTAWFSVIDSEWPQLRRAMERWLEPANFDTTGQQRRALSAMIAGERGPDERSRGDGG